MGNVGPTLPSGERDRAFLGQRRWLRHLLLVVLAVLLAGVVGVLGPVSSASADTIVVNTTVDEDDGTVVNRCALREAIIAANTNLPYNGCVRIPVAGDDVIQFNLPDASPFPSPYRLFMSTGALPPITDAVTIDGWSQGDFLGVANYHGPPLIWIDSGGTLAAGLTVSADNV